MARKYRIVKETREDGRVLYLAEYRYMWIDSWKLLSKGVHSDQSDAEKEIEGWKKWDAESKMKSKREIIK